MNQTLSDPRSCRTSICEAAGLEHHWSWNGRWVSVYTFYINDPWCFMKLYDVSTRFQGNPARPCQKKKSCWPQLLHGMAQCVLRMTFSACTIPRSLWLQMVASWVGSNMRKPWNCAHHQNRMSWQSETCNSGLLRACRLPHSILVSVSKTSLKNLSIIP